MTTSSSVKFAAELLVTSLIKGKRDRGDGQYLLDRSREEGEEGGLNGNKYMGLMGIYLAGNKYMGSMGTSIVALVGMDQRKEGELNGNKYSCAGWKQAWERVEKFDDIESTEYATLSYIDFGDDIRKLRISSIIYVHS
ncbi:hypothetical protein AMTR_s00001p00150930 [Amborella trichopoda]|uniref:Uncharacterized protein n=1 Tax=Amborella trichopoda TaxID=13333 RepID=W1NKC9_AMBTC|nr:hypothetical protein AMTR_s00001p00150930 [Amborella trichopoda]